MNHAKARTLKPKFVLYVYSQGHKARTQELESPQGKQRVRNQPKPGANEFPSPLRGQNDEKYERRKSGTADDK